MTKDEAITILSNATFSDDWQGNEDLTTAYLMAIKALEQEPSCRNTRQVDLISRQDAIDALDDIRYTDRQDWWAVLSTVENLPSEQEQERQEDIYECRNCLGEVHTNYIYCPFCGARMESDE